MSATARVVLSALVLSMGSAACKRRAPATVVAPNAALAHGGTPEQAAAEAALPRLSVDDVMARIERHETIAIYDNNSQERYQQGHVPGARWVAYRNVAATDLPPDNATPLVFYCGSEQCGACHTAALQAISLGHTNVSIMPAGIRGWTAAGKPTVTGNTPT